MFDSCSKLLFTDESYVKNVITLGADVNLSVHVDKKKKGILILGEEPTPRLHDTAFTAEAKYPIDFTQSRKRLVLRLYIIMDSTVSYLLML